MSVPDACPAAMRPAAANSGCARIGLNLQHYGARSIVPALLNLTKNISDIGRNDRHIDRFCFLERQFRIQPRCIGDIADQTVQALELALNLQNKLLPLLIALCVRHRFRRRAGGSDGIFQFMRHILRKTIAGFDASVQRRSHLTIRTRHLADFVAPALQFRDFRARIDIAADMLGCGRQLLHGTADGAIEQD